MLSDKLLNSLNQQLNLELYSEYLYLSMAAYCYSIDFDGFANFFIVQAEEEKFHAMKFFDFIKEMDGKISLNEIAKPTSEFKDIEETFKESLQHEKTVTKSIYKLMDIAIEDKEHATISFLKWFIDEQVEEESTFKTIVQKLKRSRQDINILYLLDNEFMQRTFTPPTM